MLTGSLRAVFLAVVLLAANSSARTALAQTAPGDGEIATYKGVLAATQNNELGEMRRLLAAGAAVDVRDGHNRTPAHVAAHASNYEALKLLIAAGADINALDQDRYDVITIAGVKNDLKMVQLALKLGGNASAVTSLYDGTALIASAHLGHVEVVNALIKAGAPLDHVNNLGWTALIEAVVLGDGGKRHIAIVKLLIAAGANKTLTDRNGVTPLQHALSRKYEKMAAVLR